MIEVTIEIILDAVSFNYQSIGLLIGIISKIYIVTLSLTDNKLRFELLGQTIDTN